MNRKTKKTVDKNDEYDKYNRIIVLCWLVDLVMNQYIR